MAFWYFALAVLLAATLNGANRFLRALGTLVACLSLVMMVSSIILADFDGTFAEMPDRGDLIDPFKPLILNMQAAVGIGGIGFLLWAARRQLARRAVLALPVLNSANGFGVVSRYAHWITAVLILALVPMGMFMSLLPASSPDHASFVLAHETMGVLVLMVVALRLAWLLRSPPAALGAEMTVSERRLAQAVHLALYAVLMAFPLTGLFEMLCGGNAVQVFGQTIPAFGRPDPAVASSLALLHDSVLPLAFFGIIFLHLSAVLKHHFIDRRRGDVRRMLR